MILTHVEYRLDASGAPQYVHLAYKPVPATLDQLKAQHTTATDLVRTLLAASGETSFQSPNSARIDEKMGNYTFYRAFTACSAVNDSRRIFARVATRAPTKTHTSEWVTRVSLEGLAQELSQHQAILFPAVMPAVAVSAHELRRALAATYRELQRAHE